MNLIDDVENLDDAAGGCDVQLVVEGPHVIGAKGSEAVGRRRRVTEPLALRRRWGTAGPAAGAGSSCG